MGQLANTVRVETAIRERQLALKREALEAQLLLRQLILPFQVSV